MTGTPDPKARIREVPLFANLGNDDLALLADCAHVETYHAGDYLYDEGKPAKDFLVLLGGGVTLSQSGGALGDVEVERLKPGDVVSWAWLIPPHRNWFSARANAKTEVLVFDGLCVRGKCLADARFGYDLLRLMMTVAADRLTNVRKRLKAECEGA